MPAISVFTVMVDHLQCFIEVFLIEQGSVSRNHTQGQLTSVKRCNKGTCLLQMIANGGKHGLKELLQVAARQESLLDVLQQLKLSTVASKEE